MTKQWSPPLTLELGYPSVSDPGTARVLLSLVTERSAVVIPVTTQWAVLGLVNDNVSTY